MSEVVIDPKICPLCGNENHCAYQAGRPHQECWCMTLSVPQALLEKIPQELRRKACVCEQCVRAFLQSTKGMNE
ncbi:cysteine-rich CWC family protein [Paenibacillus sp. KS1]|uniref:cysteine-rich CWC family protein n=1 Tax=Paenibacillus sp. KS1 TaxID=1849249 RepID=UPI0009F481F7|nr:cysteine-rich CWC family protein [Paenibacillus sp. KS1]